MNNRQHRALQSYNKILGHFDGRATLVTPEAAALVERLKNTVAAINEYSVKQDVVQNTRHVTVARRELERMRKEQMLPLARLARPIFAGELRIAAALRVPHKRAATDVVLTASSRMIKALGPHRKLLAASSIDPSRIDGLQLETQRLKKVFGTAYASSADRAGPTLRLRALFASAHKYVFTLDALVTASPTPSKEAAWKSMSRVGKRMGRPRKSRRLTLVDTQVA